MPGPRRSPGNGSCRDCRISGRTSPASAARRARETAGALACLVQAEGVRGSPPARAFIVAGRLIPQEALSAEAAFAARKSMRSRWGDTWLSAGLRMAREAASRCWPGCGQVQGHPSGCQRAGRSDGRGAVAPAPSHPARPGASSGARTAREAHITYMAKTVKTQMGMRYRPRLPSSSPPLKGRGRGWVRLRRT